MNIYQKTAFPHFAGFLNAGERANRMNNTITPKIIGLRGVSVSTLALLTAMSSVAPAWSAIDNSVVAVGTYTAADDTTSALDTASVPVLTNRDLSIVKTVFAAPSTAAGTDPVNTDAGTGVAAALAPTETVVFEATYTLAQLDVLNAAGVTDGISNIATASSDDIPASPPSPPALTSIPAVPLITVAKVAVLNDEIVADGFAEAGETITYTYTVVNTGNVALTNVGIQDTHEGALLTGVNLPVGETITVEGPIGPSDIGTANDGVIDTLEAGATATFTVTLTVTQAEVDDG